MRNQISLRSGIIVVISFLAFSFPGPFSLLSAQEGSVPKYPKLVVAQPVYDFGTVGQGTLVKHSFTLKNSGKADLALQRIVPACGCTATSSSQDVVAPGESATLDVEFDTTGFAGEKVKVVRLYTNDPDHLSTVITVKGRVEPDVIIDPVRVNFGKVVTGEDQVSSVKQVTIRTREGSDVRLGEVSSRSKYLELNVQESTPTKKSFTVTILPETPIGQLRDRVVIAVGGSKQKSVHIPIFANVTGPLQIEPSAVSLGVIEGPSSITRSVRLENKGSSPLNILSLKSQHPAIRVNSTTITPGKVYVVKVSIDPKKVVKDLRSSFEIKVDNEEEVHRVSVYGIVPPKL